MNFEFEVGYWMFRDVFSNGWIERYIIGVLEDGEVDTTSVGL